MSNWKAEITDALASFQAVAELAGMPIRKDQLEVVLLEAPHKPPSMLPTGKLAVYGFWGDGEWLKIGMAGANSRARYTSQHYNKGSALSTLAASLANDPRMARIPGFDPTEPGIWIKSWCNRANILISTDYGRDMLALLEAFLHVRLRPRYER